MADASLTSSLSSVCFIPDTFLLSLETESDSQFPPAGQPVRVVPSAADEDEARGNQGADPEDPTATRTG